ncbi:MAG: arginine--tRNA ligase [Prevotella sp.]|nr:arginine--tRNA ligase [Prevotella sp.]
MKIEQQIVGGVMVAVKELYGAEVAESQVQLQKTRSEFEGNLTVVVFPFVKMARKSPEQTAEEIGKWLAENCREVVSGFNAVKGFLNLVIAPQAWLSLLENIDQDENWGYKASLSSPEGDTNVQNKGNEAPSGAVGGAPLCMIEYSSPNTNKPLHLGHVRNNLLGWSLSKIMEANGWRVVKTNIVNDRGIHICKSMLAWQKWGNGETPESSGKKGDHFVGDLYVKYSKKVKQQEKLFLKNWEDAFIPENIERERDVYEELIKRYNFWNKRKKDNIIYWYISLLFRNILNTIENKREEDSINVKVELDIKKYKDSLLYISEQIKQKIEEYRFNEDYAYGMHKIFLDFLNFYIRNKESRKKNSDILIILLIEKRIINQINRSYLYQAQQMLVKWEQNDPEVRSLWKMMNDWVYAGFDETYKALGVSFDKIYYESETYLAGKKKVEEGLEKGLFFRKDDGSVWADFTNEGLDQKLLLRSDGTSVYMTQDIGTAQMRFEDYPIDKMIYVVGNEQNYHFQVLSLLLDRLGFKWGKELVHFSYGMVELPHGKMKSREGTVVDADELVATMICDARQMSEDKVNKLEGISDAERDEIARIVGMGALKYFILKVDARKNMLFNPEESIDFNGNTGPFIQYTHARIRSILRKSLSPNPSPSREGNSNGTFSPSLFGEGRGGAKEISLIQKLNEFPAVVEQAGKDYSPSGIANYCYELTKEFNQFYHDYSILNAETDKAKQIRLAIARNVAKTLKNGMALLGIEVPERM